MTEKNITVKDWLMRANNLNAEIENLREEMYDAFDFATRTTAAYGGEAVQSPKKNTTEMKFISYAEYDKEIRKRVNEFFKIKLEIQRAIEKVDDSVLRTLLFARYIQSKTWEQIAVSINYSYKHTVHNLHPKALEKIKDVIECNI